MRLRAILRLAAAVVAMVVCVAAFVVARPFGREQRWQRRLLRFVAWLLLDLRAAGRPIAHDVLYAANHVSWLDIVALGAVSEGAFVAKAEIDRWPLVGALARLVGTIFISRERRSASRDQADALAAALRRGRPAALFAEGGTGDGATLDPFRPALFVAAIEAGVAVQPVAIDYGPRQREVAWPDGVGFGSEAKRILERRGRIPVTVRFLAPLEAGGMDRKALAGAARAAVANALSPSPPGEGLGVGSAPGGAPGSNGPTPTPPLKERGF